MSLMFNMILSAAGLTPAKVRLLRHQDKSADFGRSPYHLWLNDRPAFEAYQAVQAIAHRRVFAGPVWASFVATPANETLFAGLWEAHYLGLNAQRIPWPHARDRFYEPGTVDTYRLQYNARLKDMEGRLIVDWSRGQRGWCQYAERHDKVVLELRREFKEEDFPGYLNFCCQLSMIPGLPHSWHVALSTVRGIYLLTCPRTREQYVGSATGAHGFLGRWEEYIVNGHGGNIALKSREASDYQVAILEIANSTASENEILAAENLWMKKLQSKDMGLNRNGKKSSQRSSKNVG